jgi:hypothetical protein
MGLFGIVLGVERSEPFLAVVETKSTYLGCEQVLALVLLVLCRLWSMKAGVYAGYNAPRILCIVIGNSFPVILEFWQQGKASNNERSSQKYFRIKMSTSKIKRCSKIR